MNRRSIWAGVAGVFFLLLIAAVLKTDGIAFGQAVHHGQAWQQNFRSGHGNPPFMRGGIGKESGFHTAGLVLLRIVFLIGGALLFMKAKGGLKWGGAAVAALCTLSLLTPLWGLVVLLAVALLYRRIANSSPYVSPQTYIGVQTTVETSDSRGHFLDEWERNQHNKE